MVTQSYSHTHSQTWAWHIVCNFNWKTCSGLALTHQIQLLLYVVESKERIIRVTNSNIHI